MTAGFKITIYDYLRVIFHRKWHIAISMVLAVSASFVYAFFMAKEVWHGYNHRIQVQDKLGKRQIKKLYSDEALKERIYSIYQRLATQVYAEKLMADLLSRPQFAGQDIAFEEAVRQYLDSMTMVLKGDYVAIDIEMFGPPELSRAIVERLYTDMVRLNEEDERQTIETAMGVVEQSRNSLRGSWEESLREYFDDLDPDSLEALAASGKLPGVGKIETDQVIMTALSLKSDARQQLDVVDRSIAARHGELEALKRQREEVPERIPGEVVMEANPVVIDLRDQLNEQRRALRLLQSDSTSEHPLVREKIHRIRLLQQAIRQEPAEVPKSRSTVINPARTELETKIADIQAQVEGLAEQRKTLQTQLANADVALAKLSDKLGRLEQSRVKVDLYKEAKQKLQENEINVVIESTFRDRFSFLKKDQTRVSDFPVRPNKPLVILMGFMLGIILSCCVVFVVEYADHSIKGIEDARRYLNMPIFAAIPAMGAAQEDNSRRHRRGSTPNRTPKTGPAAGLLGAAAVLLILCGVIWWTFGDRGPKAPVDPAEAWSETPAGDPTAEADVGVPAPPGDNVTLEDPTAERRAELMKRLEAAMRRNDEPLAQDGPGALPSEPIR
jgi:capsular polysaccharide biosynthesis protein